MIGEALFELSSFRKLCVERSDLLVSLLVDKEEAEVARIIEKAFRDQVDVDFAIASARGRWSRPRLAPFPTRSRGRGYTGAVLCLVFVLLVIWRGILQEIEKNRPLIPKHDFLNMICLQ